LGNFLISNPIYDGLFSIRHSHCNSDASGWLWQEAPLGVIENTALLLNLSVATLPTHPAHILFRSILQKLYLQNLHSFLRTFQVPYIHVVQRVFMLNFLAHF
jgi:hypothetical protein